MSLAAFHQLGEQEAISFLLKCCHSQRWAEAVAKRRPFASLSALQAAADAAWQTMAEEDLLEAFAAHPKIGDVNSLREKYSDTKHTAGKEQSGVDGASESLLLELARLNADYEKKNGFIFIVFATGKSATEMLELLKKRIHNNRAEELKNAAAEQAKITRIRLEKAL